MPDSQSDIHSPFADTLAGRRAERRARQRAANPARADKMHRYRLAHPVAPVAAELPALNIGCSGWFYRDWKGSFYPPHMPTEQWFSHYASNFETVEINASFYSWPTPSGVRSWLKNLPETPFVFSVKVCELITHVKRFDDVAGLVRDFGYIGDLLGARMGCFLYQLPPTVRYSPARLKAIVDQVEPGRRNVVEFRHASWWNADVYAAFREAGIIFCSCSGPKLPGDLIRTTDEVYVRLHGLSKGYDYRYSDVEIADWAERIKDSGATRVWAYFNNDYHGNAIDNARQLRALLG